MKKASSVLAAILGFILLSCGGGGGGSGSGGSGGDDQTINVQEYTSRDMTKVYTFQETQNASYKGQSLTDTLMKVYSYEQVDTIPAKYGDFSAFPGPYRKQTVQKDGIDAVFTYLNAGMDILVNDDLQAFTRIYDNDISGGGIPSTAILGRPYSSTSEEILYNADLAAGFWGEELGFTVTTMTLIPLVVEHVTVPAGTFTALKIQISYTVSTTLDGQTSSTAFTGHQWFSRDLGLVKYVISYALTANDVTVRYTITDELAEVEDRP